MNLHFSWGGLVLLLSIGVQTYAAISAALMPRITKFSAGWLLIAGALALMAVRRTLSFLSVLHGVKQADLLTECIALLISIAMAAGVVLIGAYFQKIKKSTREQQSMERRLSETQKLESLGMLASGITQQFNDQLTSIIGHADLLMERSRGDTEVLRLLDGIVHASRSATSLCQDMMSFAGDRRMEKTFGDLNQIAKESIAMARHAISPRITLEFKPATIPVCSRCDVGQVRVALMNLLHNAADAIGNEPGVISIKTGVLNCSEEKLGRMIPGDPLDAGTYCVFEIRDNGHGIEKAAESRIFDPFFTTRDANSGLGLTTVLGIVRGHYGGIEMSSTKGEGSVFRIYLPAASQDEVVELSSERSGFARLIGRSVLIMDDVESVRFITGELLHNAGMQVHRARSFDDAVDQMERHPADIDVLVVDMNLRSGPDWEAMRRLKAIRPQARFVVTSGFPEPDGIVGDDRFYGAFVLKPYNRQALLSAVDVALK